MMVETRETLIEIFRRISINEIGQNRTIRQTARPIQTDHDRQQGVRKIRIIEVRIQENMKITRTTPTKNTGQDQDQRVSQNQDL